MSLKDAKFGDILAFDGKGKVSTLINVMSGGNVSHVAFVLNPEQLIESTFMDDDNIHNGVSVGNMDEIITNYKGRAWHLSTIDEVLNIKECYSYALGFVGVPYDVIQAAKSALDILLDNKEDFNAFFCSELCTAISEFGKILPAMNASEVTPIDLCRLKRYAWCRCIKGEGKIKRFNTVNVEDFNEY